MFRVVPLFLSILLITEGLTYPVYASPVIFQASWQGKCKPTGVPGSIQSFWTSIFGKRRPSGIPGSRPSGTESICFISVAGSFEASQANQPSTLGKRSSPIPILSRKPLFVWTGQVGKIVVQSKWGERKEFWNHNVKGLQQIEYQGQALQADPLLQKDSPVYQVRLTPANIIQDGDAWDFQLVSDRDYQKHQAQLTALTKKLQDRGASSETIALERAEYLYKNKLLFDSLAEIFTIQQPSPEFQQLRDDLVKNQLCNTSNTPQSSPPKP